MHVIPGEMNIMVDIDKTLVRELRADEQAQYKILNPYDNDVKLRMPCIKNIELLKQYKGRGFQIFVWSAAGVGWADNVIQALGLENYVDYTLTKSVKYIDDLEAHEILGTRVYLGED